MVAPKLMHHEFHAMVESPTNDDPWWIAYCPVVPGANGQGTTEAEVLENLKDAIELVLQDRRGDTEEAVRVVVKRSDRRA